MNAGHKTRTWMDKLEAAQEKAKKMPDWVKGSRENIRPNSDMSVSGGQGEIAAADEIYETSGVKSGSRGTVKGDHNFFKPEELTALRSCLNRGTQCLPSESLRLLDDIDALSRSLEWALGELNMEPFEWSADTQADAHYAALAAIGKRKKRDAE